MRVSSMLKIPIKTRPYQDLHLNGTTSPSPSSRLSSIRMRELIVHLSAEPSEDQLQRFEGHKKPPRGGYSLDDRSEDHIAESDQAAEPEPELLREVEEIEQNLYR